MRYRLPLLLLLSVFLFTSCQTITRSRTELGIPESRVYFSFDDGPSARGDTTAQLLDVLKKYQIRAVFCLLGENARRYPDLVKRIYEEGHIIVNHGYKDKWASKMDEDEFRNNIVLGEEAIIAALGFNPNPGLYRPHGGFYNSKQEKILVDEGYTIVPVTVRVYDSIDTAMTRKKVARKIVRILERQGGGIVLLHDERGSLSGHKARHEKKTRGPYNRSWIPEAVEEIIVVLLSKGFILDDPITYF